MGAMEGLGWEGDEETEKERECEMKVEIGEER